MAKNVKVTLNGIKVDGEYMSCYFSLGDGCVHVYARKYSSRLPAELGMVKNDTDSQTDYFETDRVKVTPLSKFYAVCYRSALYAKIKEYKARVKHCEKMLVKYAHDAHSVEMYRQELADYSKSLAGYEAEYKKVA